MHMRNGQSIDNRASTFPFYNNRKLLVVVSALIILMVSDISLIRIYDIISKQFIPTNTKEILFAIISISCLIAEYLLLEFIKPLHNKNKSENKLHVNLLYIITKATQYVIGAIVASLILQILLLSKYSNIVLLAIILVSYVLSIGILSSFIIRILTLLPPKRNTVFMMLFVFALGCIIINAAVAMVNVSLRIGDRQPETRAFFGGSGDLGKGKYNTIDNLYFISYILSFVSAWVATAALLSNYSKKLGKIKYLLIAVSPLVFFMGQFVSSFTNEISSIINVDRFFLASSTTIIVTLSKPLGGLMLGIGFWSMAKVGRSNTAINMYLIITGFGFFLLFTANQAILMSIVPYPPFGIATITVMGLSAYLVTIGIYMSAISLSQNAELRRSIRRVARSQSKLFDSMVTAEIEREIEKRVMQVIRTQSVEMEKETGVQPSLDDQEIQDYLKQVIKEVRK
jgi:hypothetical protein